MVIGKYYSFKMKGWQDAINGVVCAIGSDWILIKSIIADFRYDGFAIIQTKRIKEWIHDEKVSFREEVLQVKGIMDLPIPDIPIDSFVAPFLWLIQQKETVLFTSKDESEAFMGKFIKIAKKEIELYSMSSEGIWESKLWNFSINDIVMVEWQSDYILSLMKYNHSIGGEKR